MISFLMLPGNQAFTLQLLWLVCIAPFQPPLNYSHTSHCRPSSVALVPISFVILLSFLFTPFVIFVISRYHKAANIRLQIDHSRSRYPILTLILLVDPSQC